MDDALEPIRGLVHRVKGSLSRHRADGEYCGLRIVRDPKNADIDIVAVHGLGSEGFKSWVTVDPSQSKSHKSWLQELLAKDVPNARIMTYGYISDGGSFRYVIRNVLYGRALDMVKELGAQRCKDATEKRPIFFIAHSLGGWIVKRALIISSEAADVELKDIELSTCGIAFFGTLSPGKPLSPSPLAHVIRRTTSGLNEDAKYSRRSLSMNSFELNESDSEWLEKQLEAFKAIMTNLPRLSFHETKKSEDSFVVKKTDAITGSDGDQIGLSATHSDLIKFQGRDANYEAFISRFRELINNAGISGLLDEKHKVFNLAVAPPLTFPTEDFSIPTKIPGEPGIVVGREDLLEQLDSILRPKNETDKLQLSIATLWGPAGTGKTTLAKHYAETHRSDISFVIWVWAESWETVVASYLEFAESLVCHYSKKAPRDRVENDLGLTGIGEMLKVKSILELDTPTVKAVVRAVKDWLMRPENRGWLLILDNVDAAFDIFDFIPLTLSGRIILTSRDKTCCPWGTELEVPVMTEAEAIELVKSTLGNETAVNPEEIEAAKDVVKHLGYHPQSIAILSSTLRHRGITISEYRKRLDAKFTLSLPGSNIDQSPVTTTILGISAMLSNSVIPVALFTTDLLKQASTNLSANFPDVKLFQDLDHLNDVFQHLLNENFIQTPSSPTDSSSQSSSSSSFDSFILESEARDHVRRSLTQEGQVDHARIACTVCVDGIRRKESDSETLPEIHDFGRIMAPHAKTCYDDWAAALEISPDSQGIAWEVLGNVCMTQGATEQAIGCFELSLRENKALSPIDRIQTSLSLATLLNQMGDFQRSQDILLDLDLLSIDKALGFRVAMARASTSAAQGELDDAESQYETLEHEQEQTLGPTDISTVNTVQRLAVTLEQLGKFEEAQALYRRVFISYKNLFGHAHPIALEALEDLANISRANNAIDDAESLYKQSVEIKTRSLGADHPSTAHAIQKLAVIDDLRGHYEEAGKKYRRALDIMSRSLNRAHPLYTTTLENMALSSRWHGRALQEDIPSPSSSRTIKPKSRDEDVMHETRRRTAFEEAERLYLEVINIKRAARDVYSEREVLATASKLQEMYENEEFFVEGRGVKVDDLMLLFRDGRRRGTV
ncbi:unnamed protein product [Clonostachys chloroleuca]|uniref:Orc1-like AAA ATPase domain-containing protein n=1 Tax=Clonostachys chloroleuca TaxID=1926264 RepID=A0AA35LWY9_9HYPO|nr:unnamed protein product [Clonostachys chloroleuca]